MDREWERCKGERGKGKKDWYIYLLTYWPTKQKKLERKFQTCYTNYIRLSSRHGKQLTATCTYSMFYVYWSVSLACTSELNRYNGFIVSQLVHGPGSPAWSPCTWMYIQGQLAYETTLYTQLKWTGECTLWPFEVLQQERSRKGQSFYINNDACTGFKEEIQTGLLLSKSVTKPEETLS